MQSYFTMPNSPVLVDDGGDVALKPAIRADGVHGTGEILSSATPLDKMAMGISAIINAATKARRRNFTNSVNHKESSSRAEESCCSSLKQSRASRAFAAH